MGFVDISILDAAARCGIQVNERNARIEMRANCPFCGDSKKHLYFNIKNNMFYCHRCGEHGNSITLYAKLYGKSNSEAYREIVRNSNMFGFNGVVCNIHEKTFDIKPLDERHNVYNAMLDMLELLPEHRINLINRGLPLSEIERNMYKSMPKKYSKLYSHVMFELSNSFDLSGIPGFYKHKGLWHMYSNNGFFIPVRDKSGNIQGLQMRLDDEKNGKYKWFSSNGYENGTKCPAFIHVVNWSVGSKVYITEGALKADTASYFMDKDICFIAFAGVGNIKGINELVSELSIKRVIEAFDMDKKFNPEVEKAVSRFNICMEKLGVEVYSMKWDSQYKGIDDMLLAKNVYGGIAV